MYTAPPGFLITWTTQPSPQEGLRAIERSGLGLRAHHVPARHLSTPLGVPPDGPGHCQLSLPRRLRSGCVPRLTENLPRLVPYFDRVMLRILAEHLERRLLRIAVAAAFDELDGRDQAGLVHQIAAIGSHLVVLLGCLPQWCHAGPRNSA